MNKLSTERQTQILSLLCEGNSLRATSRITGASLNTVTKLLVTAGRACRRYHDEKVRNLKCKKLQCDEIWSYVQKKDKNGRGLKGGTGSVWTWVALCEESRFIVGWLVGNRTAQAAQRFMEDVSGRIENKSLSVYTDGYKKYEGAIERSFGGNIHYGQLVKLYNKAGRYIGCTKERVTGSPREEEISTSYVERQNLTMRTHIKRFQRKTNAFSKKLENHSCAVALHFVYYNFCKVHKTLRVTPAMEAGVEVNIWEVGNIINLFSK